MKDIYSWILVAVLLSGTGMWVALSNALDVRKRFLNSIPFDATIEVMGEEVDAKGRYAGVSMVLSVITLPAFIYTVLISILILIFGVATDVQARVAVGSLLAIGISSMFANLGRSPMFEEVIMGLNEFNGGSFENFGKHMVFVVTLEPAAIYGQLIAILGLVFSGIMDPVESLTMTQANWFVLACLVVGLSASANVVSGRWFSKKEGYVNQDDELFREKLRALTQPHSMNVLGLVVAIILIVQSGIIG